MILTCHFIDLPKVPLLVMNINDDSVDVQNYKGEPITIPRYSVSTPVMTCDKCGQPALLLKEKDSQKEYTECPDHAKHMYEALFLAAHETKKYNRKQRRQFFTDSGKWLTRWQDINKGRTQKKSK